MIHKKRDFNKWLVGRIENAQIENEDFEKVLNSRNVEKAFHYLDPPYQNADNGHYKKSFTKEDHLRLLSWCANDCCGKFLMSDYQSKELDEFIKVHGWYKREITMRRQAPKKKGGSKTELLIWNYDLTDNQYKLY